VFFLPSAHPFLVLWSDDETIATHAFDAIYYDFDLRGTVSESASPVPLDKNFVGMVCYALKKVVEKRG
jgi:hypothetical protein